MIRYRPELSNYRFLVREERYEEVVTFHSFVMLLMTVGMFEGLALDRQVFVHNSRLI